MATSNSMLSALRQGETTPHQPYAGIYCLKNSVTGECYVGQSTDMYTRIKEHLRELRRGRHHSRPMQLSHDVHGSRAFTHEYVDFAPEGMNKRQREHWLGEKEAFFIELFKPEFNVVGPPRPPAPPVAPEPPLVAWAGRIPSLCHHKGAQLGYVHVDGKVVYFKGKWPKDRKRAPQEIKEQYSQWRLEFLQSKAPSKRTRSAQVSG